MTPRQAEYIALRAIEWLVTQDEILPVFMGATGCQEADFRTQIADSDFQGSVLDFILMDDAWVQSFCAAMDVGPHDVYPARHSLPGAQTPHWT